MIAVVLGLVIVAGGLIAAGSGTGDVLKVKALHIVGDDGKDLLTIGPRDEGWGAYLLDENEKLRAFMAYSKSQNAASGHGFALLDANEETIALIGESPVGVAMGLQDHKGTPRVGWAVVADDAVQVSYQMDQQGGLSYIEPAGSLQKFHEAMGAYMKAQQENKKKAQAKKRK